jgi:hypothetical protein
MADGSKPHWRVEMVRLPEVCFGLSPRDCALKMEIRDVRACHDHQINSVTAAAVKASRR